MNFVETKPKDNPEAMELLEELSQALMNITGASGQNSFSLEDMEEARSCFVLAINQDGKAVGCGAIRAISKEIAEVKRVYAREKGQHIGTDILTYLEEKAKSLGFIALWLETRVKNKQAVSFYLKKGYVIRENYGKYAGNKEAVCFEKLLYK
jgi:putative acetyltransferase